MRNLRTYLGYVSFAVGTLHIKGKREGGRGRIWRNVGRTGGGRGLKRWSCGGGESEGVGRRRAEERGRKHEGVREGRLRG